MFATKNVLICCLLMSCSATLSAFELSAHAGDSESAPPNSIEAYLASTKKGADYVEIDVWLTKSGKLICQHDTGTTRKFTSINKELADYDDADLKRANLASGKYAHMGIVKIPTLEEALFALPSRTKVEIDCKAADETYFEKIKQTFDKIGFDERRVVFNTGRAQTVKKFFPQASAQCDLLLLQEGETLFRVNGWFMSKDRIPPHIKKEPLDIGKFIAEMRQKKCDVIAIWTAHIDVASPQFKSAANALAEAGFKTNAWTINDVQTAKKLPPSITIITTDNLIEMRKAFPKK